MADVANSDRGDASSSEDEIKVLKAKLDSKPGIWVLIGIMVAVVTLPMFFLKPWVDSEINRLRDSIESLTAKVESSASNSISAAKSSKAAEEAATNTESRIEKLVVAIARGDAHKDAPRKFPAFVRHLPSELFKELRDQGKLESFRYSNFDNKHWFFVEQREFNLLTSSQQQRLRASFDQYEVHLTVE